MLLCSCDVFRAAISSLVCGFMNEIEMIQVFSQMSLTPGCLRSDGRVAMSSDRWSWHTLPVQSQCTSAVQRGVFLPDGPHHKSGRDLCRAENGRRGCLSGIGLRSQMFRVRKTSKRVVCGVVMIRSVVVSIVLCVIFSVDK